MTGGASARSQTVTGLTNGTNYTFQLKAVNGEGDSSSVSATATPVAGNTVPGAPRSFTATAGNTQVILNWQAPSSDGGSAITSYSYRVQITGSGTWSPDWTNITGGASARSQTVMGLTNGTNYTFELKAVNGEGDSSSVSATATPVSGNTVSGAPRNFIATAGNTQVKLKWQPPTSDGGSAITHYSYRARQTTLNTWSPNWTTVSGGGSARSQTVTGLTNGTNYTFQLKAVNGEGDSSSVSATATPATPPASPFISVWKTTSASETITLPLRSGYNYNFTVDWGDNSATSTITAHDDTDRTHTYANPGTYTITIEGTVEAWYFNNGGDKDKLYQVTNLGSVGWKSLEGAFRGCKKLTTVAGGDVSGVTNMDSMFRDANSVNPDVTNWDTSSVTDMSYMFLSVSSANPDVTNWDTSSVTDMRSMFSLTNSANPDVSGWDTSSVKNMASMFFWSTSAEPDMSQWDFRSVTDMQNIFTKTALPTANYSALLKRIVATSTKEHIHLGGGGSKYDSSAVAARRTLVDDRSWTITDGGLHNDNPFTSVWKTTSASETITLPLRSGYNYNFTVDWGDGSATSTVTAHNDTDRTHTYTNAGTYTVTITGLVEAWYFNSRGDRAKLYQVTELGDMGWKNLERAFYGCYNLTTFAGGDVSGVTNMAQMFHDATSATPDTSGWDVSSVTNMASMFRGTNSPNPDTSNWDTSSVTNMASMFQASSANPDVSNWDTSSVKNMAYMFFLAASANPDVSGWDTSSVTNMSSMFGDTFVYPPLTPM